MISGLGFFDIYLSFGLPKRTIQRIVVNKTLPLFDGFLLCYIFTKTVFLNNHVDATRPLLGSNRLRTATVELNCPTILNTWTFTTQINYIATTKNASIPNHLPILHHPNHLFHRLHIHHRVVFYGNHISKFSFFDYSYFIAPTQ